MSKQELNWTLMLLLLPSLILGLTACSGQSGSKAPPAATVEEKAAKGAEAEDSVPTAETTAADSSAAKTLAPTEATTVVTELATEEPKAEPPAPTTEATATNEIVALSTPATSSQAEKAEGTPTETGSDTTLDNRPEVSVFTINDWPIPSEAEEVEFIIGGELTYVIAWDMQTVANFYRPTFEYLGLEADCLDDVGQYTSKSCSVLQNNLLVNFSLHQFNGQSNVRIDFHNYTLEADSNATESEAEITGETEPQLFNIGDTVETGDLSFIVNEVTWPQEIGYQPAKGNRFLVIVFTMENRHPAANIEAFSLRMTIKEPAGKTYYYDGFGVADDSGGSFGSHTGKVAPGEKVRGRVDFQVAVDATELVFVIDAAELGGGQVLVALPEPKASPTADSVGREIPAFLTPADAQDVVYNADLEGITCTSPSDVATVIEFYHQSLVAEGWPEDEDFSVYAPRTTERTQDR